MADPRSSQRCLHGDTDSVVNVSAEFQHQDVHIEDPAGVAGQYHELLKVHHLGAAVGSAEDPGD